MAHPIAHEVTLDCSYDEALDRATAALKEEGFGILTRIDVHEALREKLGVDFRKYTILGACAPPLAHQALSAAPEVGLLLPCNVTVEEGDDGGSIVRFVNANEMMRAGGYDEDERIAPIGREADARLRRAAEALRSS